jgi:hypothetical protein
VELAYRPMIIANPTYDIVFLALMKDPQIARGILAAILGQEIGELEMTAQEQTACHLEQTLAFYRLDFRLQIRAETGDWEMVHVEVQKSRLARDENALAGPKSGGGLPRVRILLLGNELDRQLPTGVKAGWRYLQRVGKPVLARHYCFRDLNHDAGAMDMPLQPAERRADLEHLLQLFCQNQTTDEQGHSLRVADSHASSPLLQRIYESLAALLDCRETREKMLAEDEMQNLILAAENHALRAAFANCQKENADLRQQLLNAGLA